MKLNWRLYHNPRYISTSPMYLDLARYKLNQAQFSTFAQGGFGDGLLAITNPSDADIREAANHWLMKRVLATDNEGRIAYEGFVAEVSAQSGTQKYVRSMATFANSIVGYFKYKGKPSGYHRCPKGSVCTGKFTRTESNVGTTTTSTDLAVKVNVLDLTPKGRITDADAKQEADTLLLDQLNSRAVDINLGQARTANGITLSLWGYYSTLGWTRIAKPYKTATDIATIIQGILTLDNHFISISDYSQIPLTGKAIHFNAEAENMYVLDYIQKAIALASPNTRSLLFQIWENRRAALYSRSTSPRYFSRSDDDRIFDLGRGVIPKYMVRAGGYVVAENADPALDNYADVQGRNYSSLLESTTYDDIAESLHLPPQSALRVNTAHVILKKKHKK